MDFVVDGKPVDVRMRSKLAANDADAYLNCGVKGLGLIQIPHLLARSHLENGELVEVLPEWKPLPMPISAVYPHNRHLSPQVRVFVEWIAELFERCPLLTNQEDVTGSWHSSASATLRPNSRPEQIQECMPKIMA
jgi:LysR family transcriptional regulator for bpeEF and oprC